MDVYNPTFLVAKGTAAVAHRQALMRWWVGGHRGLARTTSEWPDRVWQKIGSRKWKVRRKPNEEGLLFDRKRFLPRGVSPSLLLSPASWNGLSLWR